MAQQQTIAAPHTLSGRGLFLGKPVTVTLKPAPANHGVVFVRTDMNNAEIPALVDYVTKRARRTALQCGEASVEVTEHLLSAAAGMGIDNLIVEIDGPEVPALDGSSQPYIEAFQQVGLVACDAERHYIKINRPITVQDNGAAISAMPAADGDSQVTYELDYAPTGRIGRQVWRFDFGQDNYTEQIAPSRTFVLDLEAEALQKQGLGTHLSPDDVLVIGPDGPLGNNAYRFEQEPVRHKVLDLIGDLYLAGCPIQGRIIAHKSGHALNHKLVRELVKQQARRDRLTLATTGVEMDIRRLYRLMPHRYPMLLVDRVLEMTEQRIVGVKNVTINEPFFQGHYPTTPIMPGVLIVEAMAQLSGILITQTLEHTGKLPVLLSLDRVKLRKPVTPGDQLLMEAEAVRVRSRIAHMRCRSFVAEELAAEAEVKFMLVDDDQE